ncbi:MAG: ABC-type transport auxiliary lipoprotein family protein [Roseiarcus sp.]|jgi:cholesterol transport system auxiliary component
MSRLGAALAVVLLLAACGGSAPETFDLSAAAVPAARPLRAQLSIREPIASLDLDSQRILVRTGPESVAYLAGAQWSDKLPILVQTRLVQTFQNARLMSSVARAGTGLDADYSLELDIQAFELDAKAIEAHIAIVAKLLDRRGGRTLAARLFNAQVPATGTGGPEAAAALNAALSTVLTQIVAFVSARI